MKNARLLRCSSAKALNVALPLSLSLPQGGGNTVTLSLWERVAKGRVRASHFILRCAWHPDIFDREEKIDEHNSVIITTTPRFGIPRRGV
jgi:hypothetical protein